MNGKPDWPTAFPSSHDSTVRTDRGRLLQFLSRYLILIVLGVTTVGLVTGFMHVRSESQSLIRSMAIDQAEQYARAIREFRTIYTAEVVATVKRAGIPVVHNYKDVPGAIPLPNTLSMMLGSRIGERGEGASTRLYSKYPFPWRAETGGLRDGFQRRAWEALSSNPDDAFFEYSGTETGTMLRYATADTMRPNCVSCHNKHPDTPKSDWKQGDLRGILEVALPLTSFQSHARAQITTAFALMGGAAALSLILVVLVINHVRAQRVRLEQLVYHRTDSLRRRSKELTTSQKELEHTIESAPYGMLMVDSLDRITLANRTAESIFGYQARELIGKRVDILIPERVRSSHARKAAEYRKTGSTRAMGSGQVLTGRRKDGSEVPLEIALSMIEHRKERFVLAAVADVSERQERERNRQQLELQLRQAQKLESVGQLAAGIAHEINTPAQYVGDNTRFLRDSMAEYRGVLNALRGLLSAAKAGSVPDSLTELLDGMVQEADIDYLDGEIGTAINQSQEGINRITEIVQAMKEFSHPGGKDKELVNLNEAVRSTVTVARNEWRYVAEMELDLAEDPLSVYCLPGEVKQVILNLIVNAAHAITDVVRSNPGTKGRIGIGTRVIEQSAEIRVEDSGGGIPESVRERIFDPFFTTKDVGKGTGQGLAIAHSVVVGKHGGTLDLETEVGKGSCFIVRLPLHDPSTCPEGGGDEYGSGSPSQPSDCS